MTVYFTAVVMVIILTWLSEHTSSSLVLERRTVQTKWTFIFATLVLVFISAFRYYVGTDYGNYIQLYQGYRDTALESIKTFDEPLLKVLSYIGSFVYDDYATMFAIASIVTVGLVARTIYKSTDHLLSAMLLYIFMGYWHGGFNAVRQCMAAAILFAGHRYIYERKFCRYLIVVLIASACHISALVMILPYFIANRRITVPHLLALTVGTILVSRNYDIIYNVLRIVRDAGENSYLDAYMLNSVNGLRIAVAVVPAFLILFARNASQEDASRWRYCMNMLIVHAVAMLATADSTYLARIGIYTGIYSTIAIPEAVYRFRPSQYQKIVMIGILFFFSLYWLYEVTHSGNMIPFQWIWNR